MKAYIIWYGVNFEHSFECVIASNMRCVERYALGQERLVRYVLEITWETLELEVNCGTKLHIIKE